VRDIVNQVCDGLSKFRAAGLGWEGFWFHLNLTHYIAHYNYAI